MNTENIISPSLEDYLETVYFLFQEKGSARVTDVAISLNISKPSVNKAINVLKSMGYVNHEHYGLLSLTDTGLEIARSVANRHYTLRRFLVNLLGVNAEKAEEEACRIEHHLSVETVDKLRSYLDSVLGKEKR